jgi:hypothetical protein
MSDREQARATHGSDICQCGDFRSQHTLPNGGCSCDRCRCGGFIFAHKASEHDRAIWDKYRSMPHDFEGSDGGPLPQQPAENAPSVAAAKVAYCEFRDRRKIMPGDSLSFEEWMEFAAAYAAQQLAAKEQEITRLKSALDRADVALYQGDNRRAWEIVCEARRVAALGGEGSLH